MHRRNVLVARIRGFTLIELSVVVLVITLLLGSLLVPLATQVEQRNVSETQKRLQEVKEALMGFAIANGRFPCPAIITGASTDSGVESPAGAPVLGDCTTFAGASDGYVPGITLGLANLDSQGFVVDAWGLQQNRIRYAIADVTMNNGAIPVPHVFTVQNGMRSVGVQALGSVFVVYSLGKNAATTGGVNTDEAVNLARHPVFVSKLRSSTQAQGDFDDILLWTSRYHVISQLTATGQIP
jgi:prepilin-type N-terminal cleavage/methylation domain-containing protein